MTAFLFHAARRWPSLLALALPAHAAVIPPGVQLHPTQTLVRNNGSEPESLDPALAESVGANNLTRDLFEGLTATDSAGKTVPGVAESWKQTDPLTWVFKLRPNAKWSNGEPVTAQDFVFGIRRFVDPKTASTYASTFGVFLANGQNVALGKAPPAEIGVKALDKLTLEVKTAFPVTFLPSLMSNTNLGPIHRASLEKFGKDWTKPGKLVGNGAYRAEGMGGQQPDRAREEPALLGRRQRAAHARDLPADRRRQRRREAV